LFTVLREARQVGKGIVVNRFAENNQATDVCEVIEIESSRDGVLERGEQTLTVRKLSQITTGWIFPCGNCFPVNRVGRRMVKTTDWKA